MKRVILTTCTCDNRYIDVLKVFLMSMRYHGNKDLIVADLINGNKEMYAGLMRIYPNMEINHIIIPEVTLLKLMHTRPPQMAKKLTEGWDQIMSMDCDVIIRGNIEGIWNNVEPSTIKIMDKGSTKKDNYRFQGGVYLFGVSQVIKDYYNDIMDIIGGEFDFFDGQAALYRVYKNKYSKQITKRNLSKKYNCSRFKKNSLVWHCKHAYLDNEKFQKEFQIYLKEANKYYDQTQ